jgi:hypothetical protein
MISQKKNPDLTNACEYNGIMFFILLRKTKAHAATIDEDEMKSQVRAAANKIMEDSRMIRLPGHITRPCNDSLWKESRSWKIDGGKISVKPNELSVPLQVPSQVL